MRAKSYRAFFLLAVLLLTLSVGCKADTSVQAAQERCQERLSANIQKSPLDAAARQKLGRLILKSCKEVQVQCRRKPKSKACQAFREGF
jgi:hypothetical protein